VMFAPMTFAAASCAGLSTPSPILGSLVTTRGLRTLGITAVGQTTGRVWQWT
jgi:hypothetical protein